MAKTYPELAAFRRARDMARNDRDSRSASVKQRWDTLQNAHVRGALFRDAIGDMVRSWTPVRRVLDPIGGHVNGMLVSAAGQLFASTRRSWVKRLVYGGLSRLVGTLLEERNAARHGRI